MFLLAILAQCGVRTAAAHRDARGILGYPAAGRSPSAAQPRFAQLKLIPAHLVFDCLQSFSRMRMRAPEAVMLTFAELLNHLNVSAVLTVLFVVPAQLILTRRFCDSAAGPESVRQV